MKKVSIFLFLSAAIIFQIGCKQTATTDNSNSANANSANANSAIPAATIAAANQVNANVKPEETPLPTFTDADAALTEGKKLLDANETEKSVEALKQSVKLNPELAEAHFNLGIALALLENETEGETPTEEPTPAARVKRNSRKKEVLELTPSQKSFAKAAEIYEKVVKKDAKDDQAFFNLGRCYNKLNEDQKAEKAFRQAVKLKPDDAYYQTQLGDILIKLSHYDDAIIALKKARSLDPNDLQVQDLLKKAEAGEERIKFGAKPTPLPGQQQQSSQQGSSRPKGNSPRQRPTPPLTINEAPLPKPN